MINKFANWAIPKLATRCERRGRVFRIVGTSADPDDLLLIRYFLFRSKLFSIYIHRFMRSDRDDPHDHPFDFVGYVVSKGYLERRYDPCTTTFGESLFCPWAEYREPGTWAFRRAETVHAVFLDRQYKPDEYLEAPLTVIFRGPERREWGFWTQGDSGGGWKKWIKWTTYLDVPESKERE